VEDNPVNRIVARRLLERRGHRVTIVGNGAEAVAVFESQPFDVILTDMQMPVMDGLEASAAIRQRERGRASPIPIIAMTANAVVDDRHACVRAGMDGYASKPVNPAELIAAIHRAVHAQPDGPAEENPESAEASQAR
jgi:CheY-like chemotaxis protein